MFPLLVIVHDAVARYHGHLSRGTQETTEAIHARRLALKGIAAIINATRNAA